MRLSWQSEPAAVLSVSATQHEHAVFAGMIIAKPALLHPVVAQRVCVGGQCQCLTQSRYPHHSREFPPKKMYTFFLPPHRGMVRVEMSSLTFHEILEETIPGFWVPAHTHTQAHTRLSDTKAHTKTHTPRHHRRARVIPEILLIVIPMRQQGLRSPPECLSARLYAQERRVLVPPLLLKFWSFSLNDAKNVSGIKENPCTGIVFGPQRVCGELPCKKNITWKFSRLQRVCVYRKIARPKFRGSSKNSKRFPVVAVVCLCCVCCAFCVHNISSIKFYELEKQTCRLTQRGIVLFMNLFRTHHMRAR